MPFVSYISELTKLANKIYPNSSGINKIKKNVRFCLFGITNSKAIKAMNALSKDEYLQPVFTNNPDIYEKPLKPYLCVKWSRTERLNHLVDHYHFIRQFFGHQSNLVLSESGITLFKFDGLDNQEYRIKLYRGTAREGGIGIKLVTSDDQKIYSLSCNVSGKNSHTMYIGMIQGPSDSLPQRKDIIKLITKSLHGLRPKALMIEIALMLARIWNINEIKVISNKGHIYQSLRYIGSKRNSVTFDYDGLCFEYGSQKIDQYLFTIPVNPPRKETATLKKTKRKLYTKRYQWLDTTEKAIQANLASGF